MRQGVLERVLDLGKGLGFVDELGRLQALQAATEGLDRKVGDGLEQGERDVLADHGSELQEMAVIGR